MYRTALHALAVKNNFENSNFTNFKVPCASQITAIALKQIHFIAKIKLTLYPKIQTLQHT